MDDSYPNGESHYRTLVSMLMSDMLDLNPNVHYYSVDSKRRIHFSSQFLREYVRFVHYPRIHQNHTYTYLKPPPLDVQMEGDLSHELVQQIRRCQARFHTEDSLTFFLR